MRGAWAGPTALDRRGMAGGAFGPRSERVCHASFGRNVVVGSGVLPELWLAREPRTGDVSFDPPLGRGPQPGRRDGYIAPAVVALNDSRQECSGLFKGMLVGA